MRIPTVAIVLVVIAFAALAATGDGDSTPPGWSNRYRSRVLEPADTEWRADTVLTDPEGGWRLSLPPWRTVAPGSTPAGPLQATHDSPVLSPPFHIGGDPVYGPQPFSEIEPDMTFDGTNHFIVWVSEDHRGEHICGGRVSPAGVVLDNMAVRIYSTPYRLSSPAVASSGENYLAVWVEWCIGAECPDIYGARVSAEGILLDPEPIVISDARGYQTSPEVAFDGTNYLVVWDDSRDGDDEDEIIYAARVSPSGTVLDPEGIRLSNRPGPHGFPEVEFDGNNYMVIWNEYVSGSGVVGTRVSPGGEVLDLDGIPIAVGTGGKSFPTLAFDGTNYMVAWIDWRYANWSRHDVHDIYCSIVSPAGEILVDDIPVSTVGYTKYSVALDFDGDNFTIVWEDQRDYELSIYAARVTPSGVVIDTEEIPITTGPDWEGDGQVKFGGEDYLIVWQGESWAPSPTTSIQGTLFSPSGSVLNPEGIAISMEANWQMSPDAAFDGEAYMVVWTDHRGDSVHTRASRVSPWGEVLDPGGVMVSGAAGLYSDPALAFDGTNYLVAWEDGRSGSPITDIGLARLTPSGQVLDPDGILISIQYYEQMDPDIAFDGENYLVVWGHRRFAWNPMPTLVFGSRVTPSGHVLDPRPFSISGYDHADRPAVAFDGTNYLVVWGTLTIQGTRVSPAGAVLDPHLPAVAPPGYWQQFPAIAFDGANYLVVWMEKRPGLGGGGEQFDVLGARVTPSLNRLDSEALVLSTVQGDQRYPKAVFDGTNYLVTWMDWRAGEQTVQGNMVTPDGVVLYPGGFPIPAGGENSSTPAVAPAAEGQAILTYSAFTPGSPYNCLRLWANMLGMPPVPATVDLHPDVLNLRSKGKYVTSYTELPEGYDPSEIDLSTVRLNDAVSAEPAPTSVGDYDSDGIQDRMIKFNRYDFITSLAATDESAPWVADKRNDFPPIRNGAEFEVVVSGLLADGTAFSGTDVIRVINPGGGEDSSTGGAAVPVKVYPTAVGRTARISYELAAAGPVSLRIFDAAGRLVRTLEAGNKAAGIHTATWDRRTDDGLEVGSGIYFVRLEQLGKANAQKLLILE